MTFKQGQRYFQDIQHAIKRPNLRTMAVKRDTFHSNGMENSFNKVMVFVSGKSRKEMLFPGQKASRTHQMDKTGMEPPLVIVLMSQDRTWNGAKENHGAVCGDRPQVSSIYNLKERRA